MISIVDYGMGNLRSVQKGLEKVGSSAVIVRTPEAVRSAGKLILPGVGAFGDAMKHLRERELIEPVREFARSGRPFLGVCLGLQLLFDSSEEGADDLEPLASPLVPDPSASPLVPEPLASRPVPGPGSPASGADVPGLGLLPGRVVHFNFRDPPAARGLKVPHMGWNAVTWDKPSPLLAGLASGTCFYFVHAYHAVPADDALTLGVCDYGYPFAAMVQRDNLFAAQFHPEKSQQAGLTILRNFADL
jgi:glutamine amidotransferase